MSDFRIVFMGTPDFAVASLDHIIQAGIDVAAVITAPDKPAGRGKKIQSSAVKQFALQKGIYKILQPTNLKDTDFQTTLKEINADLFVVVAFRMLPDSVWSMPPRGTINLHASLLPQYRGAAPINWAVINGESKTGVSTFFIKKEIDTGKIIQQREVDIDIKDNAGHVHDKLMEVGAELLVETIQLIKEGKEKSIEQTELIQEELKSAPKIFKDTCHIDWDQPTTKIYNLIRGLSPYPAAWTELYNASKKESISMKIFECSIESGNPAEKPGNILSDGKSFLKVAAKDGYIKIVSLQVAGKKRMAVQDFLRGFQQLDQFELLV